MVGRTVAVFVAVEAKAATGKPTERQIEFLRRVIQDGGEGAIVRSEYEFSCQFGAFRS